ncbi:MAG: AmmeMemoRadiSam system protein B [Planctomycetes bacterium]|nr:AmmeMemoRadiSam system protein B [Planctomycetota bacterium]
MPTRLPAVAGSFYPSDPAALRAEVDRCLAPGPPRPAIGAVAPHAGYAYSGPTAGIVFGSVEVPDVVVVIGPNHTGSGPALSVYPGGTWNTPAGGIAVDPALAAELVRLDPDLVLDLEAHEEEHGIEVEVPFILRRNPRARLVAVVAGTQDFAAMERLGAAVAELVRTKAPGALIVASSDMNHFENDATTRARDRKAVEKLVKMDERGLDEVCRREKITMCGRAPAVAMLVAAKKLGAKRAEMLDYRTSADAGGDKARCVGYCGLAVMA